MRISFDYFWYVWNSSSCQKNKRTNRKEIQKSETMEGVAKLFRQTLNPHTNRHDRYLAQYFR